MEICGERQASARIQLDHRQKRRDKVLQGKLTLNLLSRDYLPASQVLVQAVNLNVVQIGVELP